MAQRETLKRWTLYVDESGSFADSEDDVALAGLLVSEDVPGLKPGEVRRSLEAAVPGFPWPWHARLLNSASWIALVLADGRVPLDHPDPDMRWLADAVRRVAERFEREDAEKYRAIRRRLSTDDAGSIDLGELTIFDDILRRECAAELEALQAHARRARVAVKNFAEGLSRRVQERGDSALAMLVCSSETIRADAVGSPESELGDRRYFKLLEVLIDRCASLLTRRGGSHELILDLSERQLIDPALKARAKLIPLHVTRELSALIAKWKSSVRIVPAAVTRFDSQVGVRFVVVDFAANRGRRSLRQSATPLGGVESELTNDLGLVVRTGTPARSHLAASGDAYALTSKPRDRSVAPESILPLEWPRRRWACEQAWQWCRSDGE